MLGLCSRLRIVIDGGSLVLFLDASLKFSFKHTFNRCEKGFGRGSNKPGILPLLFGESCREKEFVGADNCLQRSSELMAHIQQELPSG